MHVIAAALAALALATAPALAALPGGARYVGTTSDGSPVMVKLTRDAKYVKRIRVSYQVKCSDGRTAHTYTDVLGARVRKDHTFSASGSYTGSQDGSKNSYHLSGKLSASKAHGKFSLTSTASGGGKKKIRCKTGQLTWSAKRKK
jgi:hypothetical protein